LKSILICIETLCGRISPAGFGSKEDRRHLERAREQTDASLLGAGSLRAGDPEFRTFEGKLPVNRLRAIVTRSGNIPATKSIFRTGPRPLIFTKFSIRDMLNERFGERAEVIGVPETDSGMLCLKTILDNLEQRGVESCLIEGGGLLNYEAFKQGVVTELLLTIAPKIIGKQTETCLVSGPTALGTPFIHLELLSCRMNARSGELFLHYKILDRR